MYRNPSIAIQGKKSKIAPGLQKYGRLLAVPTPIERKKNANRYDAGSSRLSASRISGRMTTAGRTAKKNTSMDIYGVTKIGTKGMKRSQA
jgi:hypothetical protein